MASVALRIGGRRAPAVSAAEFRRQIRRVPQDVWAAYVRHVARTVLRALRAFSPRRTGRFAASWRMISIGQRIVLVNRTPYAHWLNYGKNSPHRFFAQRIVERAVVEAARTFRYRAAR